MASSGLLGASALSALLAGAAQVTVTTPYRSGPSERQGDRDYGSPHVVELESIVFTMTKGDHVITMGVLDAFKPGLYWTLRDGSATVLVLAGYGVTSSDLDAMVGRRVEARGIVRPLHKKEYVHNVDTDLIDDPSLPVLPPPDFEHGFPRVSLTVLALADRSDRDSGSHAAPAGALTREIIANPSEYLGKTVHIRGQFRGANLFGDLPTTSRRDNADWVLKDGDLALWVSGKAPRGKGWSLDPGYKGDTSRWVEVVGKAEVSEGIVYLRASKLMLAAKPKAVEAAEQ
jgi:hypothetical protein